MTSEHEDDDREPEDPEHALAPLGQLLPAVAPGWALAWKNVREAIRRRVESRVRQVLFAFGILVGTLVSLLVLAQLSLAPPFAVFVMITAVLLSGLSATYIPIRGAVTSAEELALERVRFFHKQQLKLLEEERRQLEIEGLSTKAIARRLGPKQKALFAETGRRIEAINAGEPALSSLPASDSDALTRE